MKKIELGQMITILANLGVIGGIVFLAVELQQNNELLNIQVRASHSSRANPVTEMVIENPDLIALLGKDPELLTETERHRLRLLGIRTLMTWEQTFQDIMNGLAEESEERRVMKSVYARPVLNYGVPLAWETYKLRATPEFAEWFESIIAE